MKVRLQEKSTFALALFHATDDDDDDDDHHHHHHHHHHHYYHRFQDNTVTFTATIIKQF